MLAPRDHGRVVLLPTLILAFALVGCGAHELELELPRRRSSQSQGLSWALAIEVSHRLFSRLASRLIHPCAPMPADQMGSTTGWIPLGSSTYPVHPVHGAKPLAHVRLATALICACEACSLHLDPSRLGAARRSARGIPFFAFRPTSSLTSLLSSRSPRSLRYISCSSWLPR